jgi:hypothetical protein
MGEINKSKDLVANWQAIKIKKCFAIPIFNSKSEKASECV